MGFAVGDIVVIATPPKKNPGSMIGAFVGHDAEVVEINKHGGTTLYRIIVGLSLGAQFWADESMLEPEVTDAMLEAAQGVDGVNGAGSEVMIGRIYRAMRKVRRDKSMAGVIQAHNGRLAEQALFQTLNQKPK